MVGGLRSKIACCDQQLPIHKVSFGRRLQKKLVIHFMGKVDVKTSQIPELLTGVEGLNRAESRKCSKE